ncbi:hypothetical protein [Burkholderia pseudomultivorans]|uniref:hypothetical protein n=1 Tax=Burkholderia pseudomultivorans TaxID=1207504 RepID=UPI00188DF19C|nr:hypothetical protein [Burkholderia pseudomultivorans]MBF5008774.1 hypothetical protein [Burkholderia pseudomultivorans]
MTSCDPAQPPMPTYKPVLIERAVGSATVRYAGFSITCASTGCAVYEPVRLVAQFVPRDGLVRFDTATVDQVCHPATRNAAAKSAVPLFSSQGNSALHLGYLIQQTGNARGAYLDETPKFPEITFEIKTEQPPPYQWKWTITWDAQVSGLREKPRGKKLKTFWIPARSRAMTKPGSPIWAGRSWAANWWSRSLQVRSNSDARFLSSAQTRAKTLCSNF